MATAKQKPNMNANMLDVKKAQSTDASLFAKVETNFGFLNNN